MTPGLNKEILHAAVVGAGAFGRNHLRVYRDLARSGHPVTLSAIVESDADLRGRLRADFDVPVYDSIEACLAARRSGKLRVDAASVCVPTSAHFAVSAALLAEEVDVLVEKPIATSLAEAGKLIETARNFGRILQVGHLERFNPAMLAIQPCLNGPMFFEAHRLSVFTPRSLDVDVVLDLMIHDLDIVLSIVRSPVIDVRAVGLPILSGKTDIANVRLEFESGCVANFTASRVSTELVRKLRFFQPRQYVSVDYARRDVLVIDVAADELAAVSASVGQSQSNQSIGHGLSFSKPAVSGGEPLRLELEAFLSCVRSRSTPKVSAEDAMEALAVALQINTAIEVHAVRANLRHFVDARRPSADSD